MYKLHMEAPQGFDLTDVVTKPANEVLYPKTVSDFLTYLNEYADGILEDENKKIDEELVQINELTDIKAEENEIQQRLDEIVAKDPGMELIVDKLGELLKKLPEMLAAAKAEDNKA
jgi:hypothetical protein